MTDPRLGPAGSDSSGHTPEKDGVGVGASFQGYRRRPEVRRAQWGPAGIVAAARAKGASVGHSSEAERRVPRERYQGLRSLTRAPRCLTRACPTLDPEPKRRGSGLVGTHIGAHLDALEVLLQLLPVPQAVAQRAQGRGMHGCPAPRQTSRGSRTPPPPRLAGGASASTAFAPVRFRARAAATTNRKRSWSSERAGPASTRPNPSPGRGLGGAKCTQHRSPSDSWLGPGLGRQRSLAGLHESCQPRDAACSDLDRHAGSKPRPREVTLASNSFILGKLRLSGEGIPNFLSIFTVASLRSPCL